MSDIYKIDLKIRDQKTLHKILTTAKVDLNCGSPQTDREGNFIVTVFAEPGEAAKLEALNIPMKVDKEFGKRAEEVLRQKFTDDRFQGGKIVPKGLGVKK
jgi:hypothetical protein